ncbi:hypothetical protein [Kitasatospora azatica]|uniref:hypothetical protein n=1 Tax=Kitasatospora azatica TaxID=58347 RepID=UPI000563EE8C|nr:hypothetical protein [Kitasatospora azatica]
MGPGVTVAGLTLGALAVVALLAVQAEGSASTAAAAQPAPTASASASPSPSPSAAVPSLAPLPATAATGTTRRVVYSIGAKQVWLVDPKKNPEVEAAFTVEPGSVNPAPGSYTVYNRTANSNGSDGRPVEHVVLFSQQTGTVFGFSAAVDGATPAAAPKPRTGGIRSTRQDAQTLWDFAAKGTRVLVVA